MLLFQKVSLNLIITNLCFCFSDFFNEILLSIIGSIVIFVFIVLKDRISNYCRLRKFNQTYSGFDTISQRPHEEHKEYVFRYLFFSNKIKLNQTSKNKGDWETYFLIDPANPYVCTSTFNYLESGVYSGNWGTMQIWLNKSNLEIVVESTSKNIEGKGVSKYLLKKK